MNDKDCNGQGIVEQLRTFPRCYLVHLPTPLEAMDRLSAHFAGASLFVKRDDGRAVSSYPATGDLWKDTILDSGGQPALFGYGDALLD